MQEDNLDELVEFLTELAVRLIGEGVAVAQFTDAVQSAYVRAALRNARMRNSRVNQSAVAAITGLSRYQVRELLRDEAKNTLPQLSRVERILVAWRSDPEYLDGEGRPLELPIGGRKNSFDSLVRRYGGDVSSPALLAELIRTGMAERMGKRIRMQEASAGGTNKSSVRTLAAGLAHVIRSTESSGRGAVRVYAGEASYSAPEGPARLLLERRIAQSCRAMAADIASAGEALGAVTPSKGRRRAATARILVVTTD